MYTQNFDYYEDYSEGEEAGPMKNRLEPFDEYQNGLDHDTVAVDRWVNEGGPCA